jgi:hypothetical protein
MQERFCGHPEENVEKTAMHRSKTPNGKFPKFAKSI